LCPAAAHRAPARGDTNGADATDEFIAYDCVIGLREGATVDGVVLGTSVDALSINDLNQVVYIWSITGGEALFVACDAADLAVGARKRRRSGHADLSGVLSQRCGVLHAVDVQPDQRVERGLVVVTSSASAADG